MGYDQEKALIVQSDFTILLEMQHTCSKSLGEWLSKFAELVKSPEHLYTYRITSITLWNAAASGLTAADILAALEENSKFAVPNKVKQQVEALIGRYGSIKMQRSGAQLQLTANTLAMMEQLLNLKPMQKLALEQVDERTVLVPAEQRGPIKRELMRLGYPVLDLAGYRQGEQVPMRLLTQTKHGQPFALRPYQHRAVEAFFNRDLVQGASGVLVMPCGSGKTLVGIALMARMGAATLILTPNVTSARQWKRELLERTDLSEDRIGEYNGTAKQVCPVTIATYQILTHRTSKTGPFTNMSLFHERDWGLIIYDEVHLLPAPVFRATAEIQATRRAGLTATLVREDGREDDVFSLIGPKCYEVTWKELEAAGWIAEVDCLEIRVPMNPDTKQIYDRAETKRKHRIAGENPLKITVVQQLLAEHHGRQILIIGQFIDQLQQISSAVQAPLIYGKMPHDERERLYERFRTGEEPVLVVSKVANFAVDLPDASIALQVSGSFGSRQEEAQRLGRILRPKGGGNKAYFYSIVTEDSTETSFSANRQLFLVERGYRYRLRSAEQVQLELLHV